MAGVFYADVNLGDSVYIRIQEIYQYNRGFSLRLHGYTGTQLPQGQFAFEGIRQTLNVVATHPSGATYYQINVPDIMLYQPKTVHCYVYVTSSDHGQTVYDIVIPIVPRQRPADATYTQEETDNFDALLAELNSSKDKIDAITEIVYAGSGVMWAGYDENNTLMFEKAMLDDSTDAYDIAVKNGFDGTQSDWDSFVDDLLSHATPDQAYNAAVEATARANQAIAHADATATQLRQDMSNCKQDIEAYVLEAANNVASRSATVTIAPTDWTTVVGEDDMYTTTKTCSIVTAENNILVGVKGPLSSAQFSDIAAASIICESQNDLHQLVFKAYGERPLTTLQFNVIAFLDGTESEGPQSLQYYRMRVDETTGELFLDVTDSEGT